jgi:hypothetical protein
MVPLVIRIPNEHPYEVITAALTDALDRGVDKDKIRPFLQGFLA